MKTIILNYIKSLHWKHLIIFGFFCVFLAILNNVFVDESKSVEWIGSQPVLEIQE
ncbi:MAG TPA: hypothetical protein GX724_07630 [Fibrobacter sp.]|nr:hypothetical protein [Fibrobacter sp.]